MLLNRQPPSARGIIDGELIHLGEVLCHTTELAATALPQGCYQIVLVHCRQLQRKLPVLLPLGTLPDGVTLNHSLPQCRLCHLLQEVGLNSRMPQRCPHLQPGNGAGHRTDGAILLGQRLVPGALIHPRTAFERVFQLVRKQVARGKVVELQIEGV